jgi:hypothetical protein
VIGKEIGEEIGVEMEGGIGKESVIKEKELIGICGEAD